MIWRFPLFLLLLLLPLSALAIEAAELVRRHHNSVGERGMVRSIDRLEWTGTLEAGERTVRIEEIRRAPHFLRREMEMGAWTFVTVSNGAEAWQWYQRILEDGSFERERLSAIDPLGQTWQFLPEWWEEPDALREVSTSSVMLIERLGEPVYCLSWVQEDGFLRRDYFNAYNFRWVLSETRKSLANDEVSLWVHFRRFREFRGLTLPTVIESYLGDERLSRVEVDDINFRPIVFRQSFLPPPDER